MQSRLQPHAAGGQPPVHGSPVPGSEAQGPSVHGSCPDAMERLVATRAPEEIWEGPTLRELADRVEHQFGEAPALAGIYTLGFGRDEPLTPCDVHLVCDLLGLPAGDFGVEI